MMPIIDAINDAYPTPILNPPQANEKPITLFHHLQLYSKNDPLGITPNSGIVIIIVIIIIMLS